MVDEAIFSVKAGDGGNGAVHFRREKYIPKGGPDGGDGGNGGSIWLVVESGINTLHFFAGKDIFGADDGRHGSKRNRHGADGEDVEILVPMGTIVYQKTEDGWKEMFDLVEHGQRVCVAEGGKGGRGNWHFKSSTNTTPQEFEEGTKGDKREIKLELKVLAQVGLVGLPNGGKSTILSVITKANPKIANYPFTTLSPNLGALKIPGSDNHLVVADIPGLIEGASEGKGLGIQFLKHVERCEVLVYVLYPTEEMLGVMESGEKIDKMLIDQYGEVRGEVGEYKGELVDLPSLVVLNKTDLLSDEVVDSVRKSFRKEKIDLMSMSAVTGEGMDNFVSRIIAIYDKIAGV